MTTTPAKKIITREFLNSVPHKAGVYLMRNRSGRTIYVGKARDLKKRLAAYGHVSDSEYNKTSVMLVNVHHIEIILTSTEKEALILEASLIKKHKPKYNVILRDDKNYPLIKVTINEKWPRVIMTRRRLKDGARYFGPFSSAGAMWDTLNYLNTLFPLRRCNTRKLQQRSRPCINHQMGRCLAPCAGKADFEQYKEMVANILMVLGGRNRQLIRELEKRMKTAAAKLNFEEAALCRDRIKALTKTLEKQVVAFSHFRDQDVFGLVRQDTAVAISILFVRNGMVCGHQSFFLAGPIGTDEEILAEALKRFYSEDNPVPSEVMLPFKTDEEEVLADWLAELRRGRVRVNVPQRGDRLELLRLASTNAKQVHMDRREKTQGWEKFAFTIMETLQLQQMPNRIECLDISNIGGRQAVGSLVCYVNGEKDTAGYRHYKIRNVQGPDDYGMMEEVLGRRLKNVKEPDGTASLLPDLLMVDGGKGQLNIAIKVLDDLGLQDAFDLVGIAKEREGEGDKLYRPTRKNAVRLAKYSPTLLFFMRVRDEAHRFGITFHRKWRKKVTLSSRLDDIAGIGPARKKILLTKLGSIKAIESASEETLAGIPGIGDELARQIWNNFHDR